MKLVSEGQPIFKCSRLAMQCKWAMSVEGSQLTVIIMKNRNKFCVPALPSLRSNNSSLVLSVCTLQLLKVSHPFPVVRMCVYA